MHVKKGFETRPDVEEKQRGQFVTAAKHMRKGNILVHFET